MDMPKPTLEHRLLQRMIGEWFGPEKLHPSQMNPDGTQATGHITNRFALNGFVLFHDYEQQRDGKPVFYGHGVIIWNAKEQCYIMYWFHSSGLPPAFLKGTFVDDLMTFQTEDTQTKVRTTWDFSRYGQYTSRIETSRDGRKWLPFIEATYIRKH